MNSVEPSCIPLSVCLLVALAPPPCPSPLLWRRVALNFQLSFSIKADRGKASSTYHSVLLPFSSSLSLTCLWTHLWDGERAACEVGGRVALVEFVSVGFWERFALVMAQVRNSTHSVCLWNVCRCVQLYFLFAVCASMCLFMPWGSWVLCVWVNDYDWDLCVSGVCC